MPYTFQPGMTYRMPTHFGPSLGPRQGPDGKGYHIQIGHVHASMSANGLYVRFANESGTKLLPLAIPTDIVL